MTSPDPRWQQYPQQYQYPYYQQPMVPVENTAATCSLIFGLVSLLIGPCAIVGLICGSVGLDKARQIYGVGRSNAVAGMWISGVSGFLWLMFILAMSLA